MNISTNLQVKWPALSHNWTPVTTPSLEDSFILLDALELDAQDLRRMNPSVCVEIGSAVSKLSLILEDTEALTDLLLEFLKSWFRSRFSVHVQFAWSRK